MQTNLHIWYSLNISTLAWPLMNNFMGTWTISSRIWVTFQIALITLEHFQCCQILWFLRIHTTLTCPFQVPKREDIFNTEHLMTYLLLSSTLGQDEVFPFLHIESTISHITQLLLSSTLRQYKVFPFLHTHPTISHIVSPHTTHFSNKSLHCNTPTPVSCSSIFLY
jgi:hypothetical protein